MMLSLNHIGEALIDLALEEDLGRPFMDATSNYLFSDQSKVGQYQIISKHPAAIKIAGLPLVNKILEKITDSFEVDCAFKDGDELQQGETLLTITAPSFKVLMVERLLLNFLRHLSAVATLTRKYVAKIQQVGSITKVLDTRKTTPGQRQLEKYAVRCGGGENHRLGLYDAILVKDTHSDQLGGMQKVINQLPELSENLYPVIIEVRTVDELIIILEQGLEKVNRVLLDNMDIKLLAECVLMCKNKLKTEASGGITINSIGEIAKTGVDYASVGELTYAAGQVDLSMRSVSNG